MAINSNPRLNSISNHSHSHSNQAPGWLIGQDQTFQSPNTYPSTGWPHNQYIQWTGNPPAIPSITEEEHDELLRDYEELCDKYDIAIEGLRAQAHKGDADAEYVLDRLNEI